MRPLRPAGSSQGRAAHDLLFRNVHGRFLVYNACWEDPRIDWELLGLDAGSRVVMLTSAGCNALDYLLDGPAEIHAVDVNPRQNALLQLKLALFRLGDFDDLYAMFGDGSPDALERVYAGARPHLDAASADFWDRRRVYFARHRGPVLVLLPRHRRCGRLAVHPSAAAPPGTAPGAHGPAGRRRPG